MLKYFIIFLLLVGGCYVIFLGMAITGGFAYLQFLFHAGDYRLAKDVVPNHSFQIFRDQSGILKAKVELTHESSTKLLPSSGFVKVNGVELSSRFSLAQAHAFYEGEISAAKEYALEIHFSNDLPNIVSTIEAQANQK